MKLYFIINPEAGKGKTKNQWPIIYENLKKTGIDSNYEFTKYKGHARELTEKAVSENGLNGIVAVGGDGTVNEIVNGLVGSEVILGIIPTGSGNDFCKTLGLSLDPLETLITIAKGNYQSINVGEVNGRYFINVGSVGFDAAVAQGVNNCKFLKGNLGYYSSIFLNIVLNKHYYFKISLDNKVIEKKCTLVAVANGKYYGSGQKIAPQAEVTDDLFDVIVVNAVSRLEILKTLPGIREGKHLENANVNLYRAKLVEIFSENKEFIQLDGEIVGNLPQKFAISKKRINVFVP